MATLPLLSVRVPPNLADRVRARAESEERNLSNAMRIALRMYADAGRIEESDPGQVRETREQG